MLEAGKDSSQIDWRWVERYRELVAYDAYWWWAPAGPFIREEEEQWQQWSSSAQDDSVKERLGTIIAQSRRRELHAALADQREPDLWYPALDAAEVRRRIEGLLALGAKIDQQEPHVLVRQLYHGAIEEEVCFLRLIEATAQGDNERFWELTQWLHPAPTPEEMQEALVGLRRVLAQGWHHPETAAVSQSILQLLRERFQLSLELSESEETHQETPPVVFPSAQQGPMVSAQAAKRFFETVLREHGFEGWQVHIDPKASGPRVEAGLRQVFLQDHPLSVERIKYYLTHELAGHVARAVAGEHSILGLLGMGTKGHLVTEEGLSLYQERQAMQATGRPFDDSGVWFGILATGLASGVITPPQTFLSLVAFFERLHLLFRCLKHLDTDVASAQEKARNAAFARCVRTFRGVPHLEQPGVCLTKDVVYQRGLRQIEQAIATDEHVLERLMVGKIALEDVPVIEELGIALPSQSLYQLARHPDLDAYILSFEQQQPAKDA